MRQQTTTTHREYIELGWSVLVIGIVSSVALMTAGGIALFVIAPEWLSAVFAIAFFGVAVTFVAVVDIARRAVNALGDHHKRNMDEADALVLKLLAQAEGKSSAPPAPALERTPFPPLGFVLEMLDGADPKTGDFPSVRKMGEKHSPALVQLWFSQMVEAGAIVDRVEGKSAGRAAPGWNRERFIQAAQDAVTLKT